MKKLLVLLLVVVAASCNPYDPTGPSNTTQTVTVIVGGPSPSPGATPTPLPGCQTIASVTVGLLGGGGATNFKTNTGQKLDVTPRYADRSEAPANCHGASVEWAKDNRITCEFSGDTRGFTPTITCSQPGSVEVCADVAPPGGHGCVIFTVTQ